MLTTYFEASLTLDRLRSSPSSPYLDGFAQTLHEAGYTHETARVLLRAAAHLGNWLGASGKVIEHADCDTPIRFRQHLASCHCPPPTGGTGTSAVSAAKLFVRYLRETGALSCSAGHHKSVQPPLVVTFLDWMAQHRGATESTLHIYGRVVAALLSELGDEPSRYTATNLREFVFDHSARHGRSTANNIVTALRMFLRYLSAEGKCPASLHEAIPTLAHWRLSALPRYLPGADVERIIAACDLSTPLGCRDQAIILLLARLGLRAGEVAGLRLADIDWQQATLRVLGKGRRETHLPLSQQVGDALLRYLDLRPARRDTDALFLRACAPLHQPLSSQAISSIVARSTRRAGVITPVKGAHVLRHSAATEMLRSGLSLEEIRAILRHRSVETTAHYAKVDLTLLQQVVQPWPEVNPC